MADIRELIKFIKKEFNHSLKSFPLPKHPEYLYDPIRFALKGKGKRFRPTLVHLSGREFNTDPDTIMKVSLAVELLHCFTLIHDDIMDNDDVRRNMPTLYKKYDISSAILAGDGIFTISQLVLNSIGEKQKIILQLFNETVLEICEGQALDKYFESKRDISLKQYIEMVEKKTGALLGACCFLPAVLAGKSNNIIDGLKKVGKKVGIAFQIQDDLLEVFGEENIMGKSLGSDIFSNKKTVIAIEAKNSFKSDWEKIIGQFDGKNLIDIRNFLIERKLKDKVENLAESYFNSAYNTLLSLGLDKKSDLYKFLKIIQGRNS